MQAECRRLSESEAVLVGVEQDALVVYSGSVESTVEMVRKHFAPFESLLENFRQGELRRAHDVKMLRFIPTAKDRSLYAVERWCFRGAIDNWISIGSPMLLQAALEKYAPHLHRESFFDLSPW